MAEQPEDLKRLIAVATDLGHSAELRTKAVALIGNISTHDGLRALLDLAANEQLTRKERELALKYAGKVLRSGPQ